MPDDGKYRNEVRDESIAVEPTEAIEADNLEDALIAIGTALGGKAPLAHLHDADDVNVTAGDNIVGDNVQEVLQDLADRVATLEAP